VNDNGLGREDVLRKPRKRLNGSLDWISYDQPQIFSRPRAKYAVDNAASVCLESFSEIEEGGRPPSRDLGRERCGEQRLPLKIRTLTNEFVPYLLGRRKSNLAYSVQQSEGVPLCFFGDVGKVSERPDRPIRTDRNPELEQHVLIELRDIENRQIRLSNFFLDRIEEDLSADPKVFPCLKVDVRKLTHEMRPAAHCISKSRWCRRIADKDASARHCTAA
jgi:hypothetical protein